MKKAKIVKIDGKKFKLVIDTKLDIARGKYLNLEYPISSVELDDFIVFHYESKTKNLVGFTIIHLNEFRKIAKKIIRKIVHNHIKEEREYLKEKAEESVYNVIHGNNPYSFLSIPQPFWHKDRSLYR